MSRLALSDEVIKDIVKPADPLTEGFKIGCPTINIKDARASLNFYCNILGMRLLKKLDLQQEGLTDYFLGYPKDGEVLPKRGSSEETLRAMTSARTIDLRHVWDSKDNFIMGNAFDNISILVPDVYAACQRLEEKGVTFIKKPDEGGLTNLALIRDPDGYTIEIYSIQTIRDHCL